MKPVTRRAFLIFGCTAGGTALGIGWGSWVSERTVDENLTGLAAYSQERIKTYVFSGRPASQIESYIEITRDALSKADKIARNTISKNGFLTGIFTGGSMGFGIGLWEAFRGSTAPEAETTPASSPAGPQPSN